MKNLSPRILLTGRFLELVTKELNMGGLLVNLCATRNENQKPTIIFAPAP